MRNAIQAGAILIRNGTPLPVGLQIATEPCVPGWSLIKGLDGYAMDREIRKRGWTFFTLAGRIRSIAFGIDEQAMVRRAIGRILASPKSKSFNSLEITEAAAKRFLGAPYTSVVAQSRQIQETMFLSPATDGPESGQAQRPVVELLPRGYRAEAGSPAEETSARKSVLMVPSP